MKINELKTFVQKCNEVKTSPLLVLMRYGFYGMRGIRILSSNRVTIYGLKNISTEELLTVGVSAFGFSFNKDRTLLNVEGAFVCRKKFSIGKGCRVDVGKDGVIELGGGYISPNTNLIIMDRLTIGDGCAISWGCQFLDSDFHDISYVGRKEGKQKGITVGERVWIGSRVTVLKGTVIPNGCVVASNSVVNGVFEDENCLLAGNPARVIRREVNWN